MKDLLLDFFATEAGLAVQGVLILSLTDFAFGALSAIRDGTFQLDALAAFVRKQIAGRVTPIALLLAVGHFGAQPLLLGAGIVAAVAYTAETLASLISSSKSIVSGPPPDPEPDELGNMTLSDAGNPVPTE